MAYRLAGMQREDSTSKLHHQASTKQKAVAVLHLAVAVALVDT